MPTKRGMKLNKPPIVKVIWHDAWADATEPININEVHMKHQPMIMTTLGWLLIDNEGGISIANEQYIDDAGMETYRGRTFIPRAMVNQVIPFKKPKKVKVLPTHDSSTKV